MKLKLSFLLFLSVLVAPLFSQNTVGLLSSNPDESFAGYNLIFPHNQGTAFLLDNCGRIVHTWENSGYTPGNTALIDTAGNAVLCLRPNPDPNPHLFAGGGGSEIAIKDWNNNTLWRWSYSDSLVRLHHDIILMPNGHILAIAWRLKSRAEAIAAGRDTINKLPDNEVWSEHILEIEPVGTDSANIVWEWDVWDHLVQDFDATKANYGSVKDSPHLVNINYGAANDDWLHMNGIDYNPYLDQIILSVPTFNEVWIIDHSTSTIEASGHTGGNAGMGGDLIYRWGNPLAHGRGSAADQKLFFQHDIHWADLELTNATPGFGSLMVFNNRVNNDHSEVGMFSPVFDSYEWEYPLDDTIWGPSGFSWTYAHPDTAETYSTGLGSVQLLKNENTLVCAGRTGYSYEIDENKDIVWEYKTPLLNGSPVVQGSTLSPSANLTFRMKRYSKDYKGFSGKTLTPQGYIELNPDTSFCPQPTGGAIRTLANDAIEVMPNPFNNHINVKVINPTQTTTIEILDVTGRQMYFNQKQEENILINTQSWLPGFYILRVNKHFTKKLILLR